MSDIQLCNCLDKTPNTGDHSECCAYRLSLRIAELEAGIEAISNLHKMTLKGNKEQQKQLDAVRESQYDCPYTDCGCCNAVRQALLGEE